MIIAVDGPTASGKGTIAKALAAHFGLPHLDTGLLYRATGRRTLNGTDPVAAARAQFPELDLELRPGTVGDDPAVLDAIADAIVRDRQP